MQDGNLEFGPVMQPTVEVAVSGTPREVDSYSLTREIPSDLPESIVGGSGITAASGSVKWKQLLSVTSRAASAFASSGGWPPKSNELFTLEAGYGDQRWQQIVGVLDGADGGTSGDLSSGFTDRVPRLNWTVTVPPELNVHPPTGGRTDYRRMGLRAEHVVNRVLRSCGFYATPPAVGAVGVSAPLQGSCAVVDSNGGDLVEAHPLSESNAFVPRWPVSNWGMAMADGFATYTPNERRSMAGTTEITFMIAPEHAGTSTVTSNWGATKVLIGIYQDRGMEVQVDGVAVLTALPAAEWDTATLQIKGSNWKLRTNGGEEWSISHAAAIEDLSDVTVTSDDLGRIAGVLVNWPGTEEFYATDAWKPTANFDIGFLIQTLDAVPAQVSRNAFDLLTEIAKAMCVSFWIDEHGVVQWVHPDRMRSRLPVKTVTSARALISLDWRDRLIAKRSRVVVVNEEPNINISRVDPVHEVWRGSGDSVPSGATVSEFISPPADETWLNVDGLKRVTNVSAYTRQIGSFYGGFGVAADDTEFWDSTEVAATMDQIGVQTWKIITTSQVDSGSIAVQKVPTGFGFPAWHEGANLAVLRAAAKVKWLEDRVPSLITGEDNAEVLEHNVGRWVQGDSRQQLADFLAEQVTSPIPEINNLEILSDPRLQLGDQIWVEDPDIANVRVRGIIMGSNLSGKDSDQSMNLTVRVVEGSAVFVSNAAMDTAYAGVNNEPFDLSWAGSTNADLDSTPLREAP